MNNFHLSKLHPNYETLDSQITGEQITKTKLASNNKNEISFAKHKNKIVYENVLVVRSIHNLKDSLEKYKNYR